MPSFRSLPSGSIADDAHRLVAALGLAPSAGIHVRTEALVHIDGRLDGAPIAIRISEVPLRRERRVNVLLPFRPALESVLGIDRRPSGSGPALVPSAARPERAAALVPPEALAALERALGVPPGPNVVDTGVLWAAHEPAPWGPIEDRVPAIRALPVAWWAIRAASFRVPPVPGSEPWMAALAGLVREGLALRGAPSGLVGEAGGVPVAVTTRPMDGGWRIRATVDHPRDSDEDALHTPVVRAATAALAALLPVKQVPDGFVATEVFPDGTRLRAIAEATLALALAIRG